MPSIRSESPQRTTSRRVCSPNVKFEDLTPDSVSSPSKPDVPADNHVQMKIVLALQFLFCLIALQSHAADLLTVTPAAGDVIVETTLRNWSRTHIGIESSPRELPIDDVLSLQFARTAAQIDGGDPLVILANGDRLVLRSVGIFDDVLTATWHRFPMRQPINFPLDMIAAIIFDVPTSMTDRRRLYADLRTLPPGSDVLLLVNGDRLQGDIERLDASIHLKTATGLVKVDRHRVRAARMNPELTNVPKISGRRLMLSLTDGSHLTVQSVEIDGREMKCSVRAKLELSLPSTTLVGCRIYGQSAVPLSERDPVTVKHIPFLSQTWSMVKNSSAIQTPLSIRGVEYATGLGMHSRMLATYPLSGAERQFRATVGVDDCAEGMGSVRFAVELDGRRVWESLEITGRSPAFVVPPVSLLGAKQLTLFVDYGNNADVADYADWCDAVFVMDSNAGK